MESYYGKTLFILLMSLILTDRWFEIPQIAQEHRVQYSLKEDLSQKNKRAYIIAAGRRSYKTERFCKRYAISEAINNPNWEIYLGAPTRMQAKEILWEDVKNLVPPYLLKRKPIETELRIELINKTKIHIVGLQEFKRIHGGRSNLAVITEYQDCEPAVYTESFQPMLNDTGGIWIAEGRPFGKNHFYDQYMRGVNNEPGWGSYHWKSSEILSEEQIRQAQLDLALKDYQREYDASFETEFGAPYYPYLSLNNKTLTLNPNLDLIFCCDFNATEKPMSWVIGQKQNVNGHDETYWHKVLAHQYTNTETMCGIAIDWLKEYFKDKKQSLSLNFYGDYSGIKDTSNSNQSDWEIIEKKFRNEVRSIDMFRKPCLSIRDSIAATNAQLCNTKGERRQFVNYDECKPLIWDWEKCEWKENNRELQDKDPLRGHACFVAGTLIATNKGEIPINKIKAGNYVLTPKGERKVLGCGITNLNADVYEYRFSNGENIICTKEHPFYLKDGKQLPVSNLMQSDIIVILDYNKMRLQWKLFSITELDMLDTPNQKIGHQDYIINQVQKENLNLDYINKFMLITLGKFRRVITSIIKTATHSTMNCLTWKQSQNSNILVNMARLTIRKIQNYICGIWIWEGKNIIQESGQLKIENELLLVLKKDGKKLNTENIFARFVKKNFNQGIQGETINTVLTNAIQNNEEISESILKNEYVNGVAKSLYQTNISDKSSVPLRVAHIIDGHYIGKAKVWNMCVEDEHKYFANGFLVSNCRAVDYYNDFENPVRGKILSRQGG